MRKKLWLAVLAVMQSSKREETWTADGLCRALGVTRRQLAPALRRAKEAEVLDTYRRPGGDDLLVWLLEEVL